MTAMPNLKINIQQPQEMCKIKPFALAKIYLHAHRFWSSDLSKAEYAYGILVGNYQGETRVVEKVVPVLHSERSEVVFDDKFYKHWEDLNTLEEELESGLFNIGWYKVVERT